MRMRKKKNLHPRMDACESCWIRQPEAMRGHWRELYPRGPQSWRWSWAAARGRFTAGTAKARPDAADRRGEGPGRNGGGHGAESSVRG